MLKVAALVDLQRSENAGGHVKGWERLAAAAARSDLPLQLTVFFSGTGATEKLSAQVILRQLPPVFSTAHLKFLPYIPDHTDLAPWHPALAKELAAFDVIHTTDAFFAFARTAERLAKRHNIPLTHSFHTDQPSYARIFTTKTIRGLIGDNALGRLLLEHWQLPQRKEQQMLQRLQQHLRRCAIALATRPIDLKLVSTTLGSTRTRTLHLATDKQMFNPSKRNRTAIEQRHQIPPNRIIIMFAGRLDEGKNIYTLIAAMEQCVAAGLPLHLVAAGVGPAAEAIRTRLPHNATIAGFVPPPQLAELYASADLYALVSEVELRSQVMVESLASALPVLVAEKSGVASLLAAPAAIISVQGDATAWVAALTACTEPSKLMALRHGAGAAVNSIKSWDDILREDLWPVWQQAATAKNMAAA
jgi:glycosyltransferase involved in cell wall biosynthesis